MREPTSRSGEPDQFAATVSLLKIAHCELNHASDLEHCDGGCEVARLELAEAREREAIGPCGKHMKMFWVPKRPSAQSFVDKLEHYCSICREIEQRERVYRELVEIIKADASFLRRYLEQLIHVPTRDERGHIVNGFAAAQIPDWAMKQRLADTEAALAEVAKMGG